MPTTEGTILVVQEGRFRLLTDDGRGLVFLLASDAAPEPQDLPPLRVALFMIGLNSFGFFAVAALTGYLAEGLRRAAGFLRTQLARRIKLYTTPELRFEYDESVERGDRLSRLIDSTRRS